jgi:hypothetical protein
VRVAEQEKLAAEQQKLAAVEQAEAIKVLAEAKEIEILKAGVTKEIDRVPLEIERETRIGIAKALSTVKVPGVMFIGGTGDGQGDQMSKLINLWLLQQTGALPPKEMNMKVPPKAPAAPQK